MNEKSTPKVSIGIISLVIIFAVLCLTTFAVMTLTTAVNSKKLSVKSATTIENYYRCEANSAALANEIGRLWQAQTSFEEMKRFADANNADCTLEKSEIYFSYHFPVDEGQALFVVISLGEAFVIREWAVRSTKEWEADQGLQVWDGEL